MKIVAIRKCSDVGEMWTETKIFEPTVTLAEVMEWNVFKGGYSDKDIILTIAKEAP